MRKWRLGKTLCMLGITAMAMAFSGVTGLGNKLGVSITAEAETFTIGATNQLSDGTSAGEYKYSISGNDITIDKYYGTATTINLPNVLKKAQENNVISKDAKIVAIGYDCFAEDKDNLKSIVLPRTLKTIGHDAFTSRSTTGTVLTSVTWENTGDKIQLTSIGEYAFFRCKSLTGFEFGDNLTTIGRGAFKESGLTDIKIPASCTSIEGNDKGGDTTDGAFYGCEVRTLTFEGGNISLGLAAFSNCEKLTSVTFKGETGDITIGKDAFYNCTGLTNVVFNGKAGNVTIGEEAFYDCSKLENVTFNNEKDKITIGTNAFYNCSKLANVAFAKGTSSITIGGNAFYGCSGLELMDFGIGVSAQITDGSIPNNSKLIFYCEPKEEDKSPWKYAQTNGIIYQKHTKSIAVSTVSKHKKVFDCLDTQTAFREDWENNIVLDVVYADGTNATVKADANANDMIDNCIVEGFDSSKAGIKTISIKYGGASQTYDITVYYNLEKVSNVEALLDSGEFTFTGTEIRPGITVKNLVLGKNANIVEKSSLKDGGEEDSAEENADDNAGQNDSAEENADDNAGQEDSSEENADDNAGQEDSAEENADDNAGQEDFAGEPVDCWFAYTDNVKAGNATVTIEGNEEKFYTGTLEIPFTIKPADIQDIQVDFDEDKLVYDGTKKTPKPISLTLKSQKSEYSAECEYSLTVTTDYAAIGDSNYSNNVNASDKAALTISAAENGNFTGEGTFYFTIEPKELNADDITIDDIDDMTYTGKALTPDVVVNYTNANGGKGLTLVKDTDYTVTYSNNINANTTISDNNEDGKETGGQDTTEGGKTETGEEAGGTGENGFDASTGTGDEGETSQGAENGNDAVGEESTNNGNNAAGGEGTDNGNDVTAGEGTGNDNEGAEGEGTDSGTEASGTEEDVTVALATVTITAIEGGNYSGEITKTFKILPADLTGDDVTVTLEEDKFEYTGKKIEAAPVVKIGDVEIDRDSYELVYDENNSVFGEQKVTVNGTKNLTGSVTKTYQIIGADISKAEITPIPVQFATGSEITPEVELTLGGQVIDPEEYDVSYEDNVNIGKATVTIKAKGAAQGAKDDTAKEDEENGDNSENAEAGENEPTGDGTSDENGGNEETTVADGGNDEATKTEEGNGSEGTTVTDAGNENAEISDADSVDDRAAEAEETTGTKGNEETTVTGESNRDNETEVTDENGEKELTDENGETTVTGDNDEDKNTTDNGEVTEDTENSEDEKTESTKQYHYIGEISTTFTIKGLSFAESGSGDPDVTFSFVLDKESAVYSGQAYTPEVTVKKTIKGSNEETVLKKDEDYSVTAANSVHAGSYTMTVTGQGIYEGSRELTYTIEPKNLSGAVITAIPEQTYTGKSITPTVSVALDGTALKQGDNFEVSYSDNVEAGKAAFTVTGVGDYTGEITGSFTITKPVEDEPKDEEKEEEKTDDTKEEEKTDDTTKEETVDTTKEEPTTEAASTEAPKQEATTEAPAAEVTVGVTTTDDTGATYTVTEVESDKIEVEYSAADTTTKKVEIPATVTLESGETATVTAIADNAFSGNSIITAVSIPTSVEVIGENAFNNCKKLKSVTISKNVVEIGKNAFAGCTSLTKVTVKGTSLNKVEQGAFKNCKKLTNITLPKSVTEIGKNAFSGDKKLKTITIKSTKLKKVGKNAFKNVPSSTTIKVPAKQKKAYTKLLKKAGFKGKIK